MERALIKSLTQDFNFKLNIRSLKAHPIPTPDLAIIIPNPMPSFRLVDLADLTIELKAGRYRVGYFERFFIRLKTFFWGNYENEITKRSFRKIANRNTLLDIASNYISLQKNATTYGENMEKLRKLRKSMSS
ncbi:MAG: hypothetical protein LBF49_03840 [Puniceicoccales bacterium]|jgi:hypothetical protein|nr:hypothetical protein [Puniceicoccales bacterium]